VGVQKDILGEAYLVAAVIESASEGNKPFTSVSMPV
jgi:hypothetical protein